MHVCTLPHVQLLQRRFMQCRRQRRQLQLQQVRAMAGELPWCLHRPRCGSWTILTMRTTCRCRCAMLDARAAKLGMLVFQQHHARGRNGTCRFCDHPTAVCHQSLALHTARHGYPLIALSTAAHLTVACLCTTPVPRSPIPHLHRGLPVTSLQLCHRMSRRYQGATHCPVTLHPALQHL